VVGVVVVAGGVGVVGLVWDIGDIVQARFKK
jgi:hypothetical protein